MTNRADRALTMKAILVIPAQADSPLRAVPCLPLFPVADRPFLQHVVEALAARGATEVQVVCGHGADAVERFLGDGARWGCRFEYHLLGDPEQPTSVLRAAAADAGPVVVARADTLPALPPRLPDPAPAVLFGTKREWSGWAVADARELAGVPDAPLTELAAHLAAGGAEWSGAGPTVALRSVADAPAAQRAFLDGQVPGALLAAREVRPGVWLARNVSVSPTSRLEPPVFVGENTVVGSAARVGPFAAIGPDCLLDRDCAVRDSTVCAGTYVGRGVELDGVIADGPDLMNPLRETVATIDRRLLDRLAPALPLASGPARLLAAAAFLVALPVVGAAALWLRLTRPGPVFWARRFALPPAGSPELAPEVGTAYTLAPPRPGEEESGWVVPATLRGLVLELMPALWSVARGNLRLVGLPPRGRELLRADSALCPALLRAAPGLVTEIALFGGQRLLPEDRLLVDAYQAQTAGPVANLKRACRFLLRSLTARGKPAGEPPAAHVVGPDRPVAAALAGAGPVPVAELLPDAPAPP